MNGTLRITANTALKKWPWDTKTLYEEGLLDDQDWKKEGEEFRIEDSYLWDGIKESENDDHVVVLLEDGDRRYVYAQHCQLELDEDPTNQPEEEPTKTGKTVSIGSVKLFNRGKLIRVPGISHKVGVNDPIYYGSKFTWGEATKNGERIPETKSITYNIVKAAHTMDEIRQYLGNKPIRITSWYRTSIVNRRVGGAPRSYHLTGKAVDFYPTKMDLIEAFMLMKKFQPQGGLAVGRGFIHFDSGPSRRWAYVGGPRVPLW